MEQGNVNPQDPMAIHEPGLVIPVRNVVVDPNDPAQKLAE